MAVACVPLTGLAPHAHAASTVERGYTDPRTHRCSGWTVEDAEPGFQSEIAAVLHAALFLADSVRVDAEGHRCDAIVGSSSAFLPRYARVSLAFTRDMVVDRATLGHLMAALVDPLRPSMAGARGYAALGSGDPEIVVTLRGTNGEVTLLSTWATVVAARDRGLTGVAFVNAAPQRGIPVQTPPALPSRGTGVGAN